MKFCPECGMMPVKFVKKNGEIFGVCNKGHEFPIDSLEVKKYESIKKSNNLRKTTPGGPIDIDKEKEFNQHKTTSSIACPKCGSKKCKLLYSFTPYGDEDQINIWKCQDCGKVFREGEW